MHTPHQTKVSGTRTIVHEVNNNGSGARHFSLSANRVTKGLLVIIAIMLVFHIIALALELKLPPEEKLRRVATQFFNFGHEANFPTYFSALILLASSVLCFYISFAERNYRGNKNRHWQILGFVFVFLSFDEAVQIHEQTMVVVHYLMPGLPSMLASAWVIPYALLAIAGGIYFLKFVISLPARTRNLFIISGGMFVAGALGLEMVESYFNEKYGDVHVYSLMVFTLQELLEMVGITFFIYALLDYISSFHKQSLITVNSGKL